MKKMNAKVKAKWIAALRSGDYKQTRTVLRNSKNEFCCLGVLCNIHAQEHPKIAAKQEYPDAYMGSVGMPPSAVCDWAGIDRTDNGAAWRLARMNDNEGASFKEIANWIKNKL